MHIDNCHSLKEKRRIVTSLKEKLKNRYNVAICEFGDLSLWQRTQLGLVTCGNTKQHVDSSMRKALDFIDKFHAVSLLKYDIAIT
ncbi:MAG: DUF503 domain-containing protein [candidate division WOR-3 bacterium]|nr:MAG: DUF503 domain-containing protein [candidate division WOR-3 bacterium]